MDQTKKSSPAFTTVKDPVCGMSVNPASARGGNFKYKGTVYYFCNPKCNERFKAEPEKYLDPKYKPGMPAMTSPMLSIGGIKAAPGSKAPVAPKTVEKTIYVCPMDPE